MSRYLRWTKACQPLPPWQIYWFLEQYIYMHLASGPWKTKILHHMPQQLIMPGEKFLPEPFRNCWCKLAGLCERRGGGLLIRCTWLMAPKLKDYTWLNIIFKGWWKTMTPAALQTFRLSVLHSQYLETLPAGFGAVAEVSRVFVGSGQGVVGSAARHHCQYHHHCHHHNCRHHHCPHHHRRHIITASIYINLNHFQQHHN